MENKKFTKNTRLCLIISGAIIVVALCLNIFGVGLNLGIDFTGGSLLEYSVGADYSTEEVTNILARSGYTSTQVSKVAANDGSGALTGLQIRLWLTDYTSGLKDAIANVIKDKGLAQADYARLSSVNFDDKGMEETDVGKYLFIFDGETNTSTLSSAIEAELEKEFIPFERVAVDTLENGQLRALVALNDQASAVRELLENEMTARYPQFKYENIEHVGAVSGSDLVRNALLSLLVALALMLIYIALRFDLYSGVAALSGLAHDVLIMCAFMSFARALYQVNSSFIAALLTIVGYSINNTIIVFDRVRENKKAQGKALSNIDIVEKSVGQSFSRTINTTLTTLFALVSLYILGVDSIREFTFPLIIGMLSGSYSALFINGPIWAKLVDKAEARKSAKLSAKKA